MKTNDYKFGVLVFLPQSSTSYSTIWIIARLWDDQQTGRKRCVCHRIDTETGLPMVCPDPRCKDKGLACCAITTNGGWMHEVEPLSRETIELFSTEEPTVLDRTLARKCLALVPERKRKQTPAQFAQFLDDLLNR